MTLLRNTLQVHHFKRVKQSFVGFNGFLASTATRQGSLGKFLRNILNHFNIWTTISLNWPFLSMASTTGIGTVPFMSAKPVKCRNEQYLGISTATKGQGKSISSLHLDQSLQRQITILMMPRLRENSGILLFRICVPGFLARGKTSRSQPSILSFIASSRSRGPSIRRYSTSF